MIFNKPISQIEYKDIEDLTASGEVESNILDYKKMVSGLENEKKEIAKDICAFANSQGGYLVIGVEERDGKPVHPPCGTSRMIERQKVEEWVEQITNSNIAQRVNIDFKIIDIANSDNWGRMDLMDTKVR
jgi:predicted HTH transcriptional regulator